MAGQVTKAEALQAPVESDEMERLFVHEKFEVIREQATLWLEAEDFNSRGYYWLARLDRHDRAYGRAFANLETAYALNPLNIDVVTVYLDVLFCVDALRKAWLFHDSLPAVITGNSRVKFELSWLYRTAGWPALARKVLYDDHPSYRTMSWHERMRSQLVVLTIDRLTRRRELRQLKAVRSADLTVAIIDAQSFSTQTQRFQAHASVDQTMIDLARRTARIRAVDVQGTRLWLLCSVIAGLVCTTKLHRDVQYLVALPILVTVTFAMVGASAWIFNRISTYVRATLATSLAALVPAGLGVLALRSTEGDLLHWLATSVVFATAVTGGIGALYFLALALWSLTGRGLYQANCLGWIVGTLARISAGLADCDERASWPQRREWIRDLERVARLTETHLADRVTFADANTRTWLNAHMRGVGESIRHLKRHLVAPSRQGWTTFERTLRQQLHAFATENWHAAHFRKPPEPSRLSRRERALSGVKLIAGSLAPGLIYLAIAPLIGADKDVLQRAAALSGAWLLLSVLLALDPAFREKTLLAKEMLNTWSPLLNRKTDSQEKPAETPRS